VRAIQAAPADAIGRSGGSAARSKRSPAAGLALLLSGAFALVGASAGTASSEVPLSSEVPVSIVARAYQPAELTVQAGETVTWTNHGFTPHTVTAAGGEFDSGRLNAGESFKVTFSTPGSFPYACMIHPSMHGNVTVLAPGSLPPGGGSDSLTLTLARARSPHGPLTLVHVQAPRPGASALLQLRPPGGRWTTVRRARLSSSGRATLSISARLRGKLRVVVQGAGGASRLVSRTLAPDR
jgi:plastocyanin